MVRLLTLQSAMHNQWTEPDLRAAAARMRWPLPTELVIVIILAFNFLGDGLRDAADPNN
jgi:ABC-type dipeptide/oligopeptide/nickel transport system permease subunit